MKLYARRLVIVSAVASTFLTVSLHAQQASGDIPANSDASGSATQDAPKGLQQPASRSGNGAEPHSNEIQQVTITAQRRATLMKDTPISVQAITSQQMDNEGVHNIDDLTRVMPGVNFNRNGTTATGNYNDEDSEISVRGIYSSAGASTTGIYIDDTPIQTKHVGFGSVNPFPALFDLDRVEMLRGPQGTLFGAGSEGGAVRFIQPEPSLNEESVYLRSDVGSTKNGAASYEVGAAIGQPLVQDVVGFRLAVSTRKDGGYVDRVNVDPVTNLSTGVTEHNANWEETTTIRGALKVAVSKDTSIIASVYHQQLKLNDTSSYWETLSNPSAGQFLNGNAQPDTSQDPLTLSTIKINSDLGWSKLTSSTSYFSRHQTGVSDYTQFTGTLFGLTPYASGPGSQGSTSSSYFSDTQHNVIEELKLQSVDPKARLTWVAGLFLSRQDENSTENWVGTGLANTLGIPAFPGLPYGDLAYIAPAESVDRQIALFGQTDFNVTDTVKLTTGLRVASIRTSGNEYAAGPLVAPTPLTANSSLKETPVTPKIGLSWQPDVDDMMYASAAKGYRVGGINLNVGALCGQDLALLGIASAPDTYKSDSLWSYEIGSKNSYLNRSLQIDSSAFYVDWKNIQQNVYLPYCGAQFAANLGAATSKGLDTSMRFKPVADLLLTVDVAYTEARYRKTVYAGSDTTVPPIVSQGDFLTTTPWSLSLAVDYKVPGFDEIKPYLHADYQLNTRQQGLTPGQDPNNAGSYDPTAISAPETKLMALRAGSRWNGWDTSLYVNNLFNSTPELVHQHDLVGSPYYFDRTWRPRTIGLTVNYRY